jgi:hypothetical protein
MFPITTHCFADVVQIRHAYQNDPLQHGKGRDEEIFLFFGAPELAEPRPDTRSNDRGGCSIKAGGDSNPWRADSHARVGEAPRKRSRIYKSFARSHPKSKMRFAERSQK